MPIAELLSPGRVSASLAAATKEDLLHALAGLLAQDGSGVERNAAYDSMLARERTGSTGFGGGLAVPHGRLAGLARPVGAFARLARPMDFAALDNQPVRFVFALLVPADAAGEHLLILAELARAFRAPEVADRLVRAKTPEELYNCLIATGTA
jgi:PTS system nitrogen regulatory IIA component